MPGADFAQCVPQLNVYTQGDYPQIMKERVGDRLPVFTEEQKADLKGSADFLGLNTYTTNLVTDKIPTSPGYWGDLAINATTDLNWVRGECTWLYYVPVGMRKFLRWLKKE